MAILQIGAGGVGWVVDVGVGVRAVVPQRAQGRRRDVRREGAGGRGACV